MVRGALGLLEADGLPAADEFRQLAARCLQEVADADPAASLQHAGPLANPVGARVPAR